MAMNIVLMQPEIPQNTGNIARTCALTKSRLHLIKPLGFSVSDKYLKRAGLDYWNLLDIFYYDNIEDFFEKNPKCEIYYASTKVSKNYADVKYNDESFIVFGRETGGIPEEILKKYPNQTIRIPMRRDSEMARSLNLANSVNIVLYEALRQQGFPDLS